MGDAEHPDDIFAWLTGFVHDMVDAGRLNEDRPEDQVARKILQRGFSSLSENDRVIANERLAPLAMLYYAPFDPSSIYDRVF